MQGNIKQMVWHSSEKAVPSLCLSLSMPVGVVTEFGHLFIHSFPFSQPSRVIFVVGALSINRGSNYFIQGQEKMVLQKSFVSSSVSDKPNL